MALSMNGALNHWFTRFVSKLNTTVLLGDEQQFCYGFKGIIFSAKFSKNT